MRRALSAVLATTVALAGGAGCDKAKLARWCDTYQRGYAYVDALVIPALDMAAAADVAPAWTPAFLAAKATLGTVNATLVAACEKARAGSPPDPQEVGDLVAQGAAAMQELIRLHQSLPLAAAAGTREIGTSTVAPPSPDARELINELAKLEAEARPAR